MCLEAAAVYSRMHVVFTCCAPVQVWTNPYNKRMFVSFPKLQPRKAREVERALAFSTCDVELLSDRLAAGRKDLVMSTAGLLTHYWGDALKPSVLNQSE
eukprot:6178385-Pleurochrysis_carterae.AAC.1